MKFLTGGIWIRMTLVIVLTALLPLLGLTFLSLHLLEKAAIEEARQRHKTLANLTGALVKDYITGSEMKLSTMGKMLARELKETKAGKWNPKNKIYRDSVVNRLNTLVDPPDQFLEVQYFANGANPEFVAAVELSQLVTQMRDVPQTQGGQTRLNRNIFQQQTERQQGEVIPTKEQQQKFQAQQRSQILMNSDNVQMLDSMRNNASNMASRLNEVYGFNAIEITSPVSEGKLVLGSMIAYLDFETIIPLLDVASSKGYHVQLHDGDNKLLMESGVSDNGDNPSVTVPVGFADWTLRISEPSSKAFAAFKRVRLMALTGSALLALLLTLAVLLITRHIASPLSLLTQTATAMEAGDLSARSNIKRSDEVGALATAFDRMASSLEQLDSAKSAFMGNVSHELRTPLTSIRLSLSNLAEGIGGPLTPAQEGTITRLGHETDRMIHLVNDLLELARLESGSVPLARETLQLSHIARVTTDSYQTLAEKRGIGISVEGEGTVQGDHALICRVISNLLDNALKFSPEKGTVTLRLHDGGFEIADRGPGLPEGDIFEKFVQGRRDGVKNSGVGLGLAMVKRIIDLHGGTVQTRNDGGAVFKVQL